MNSVEARIARLEKFLEADPHNLVLLDDLAKMYETARDYTGAVRCYERMVELGEEGPILLNSLGRAEMALNRLDDAIEHFKAALRADPGASPVLFNLGYAEFSRDNPVRAAECFDAALALEPNEPQYLLYRAMAYDALEQSGNAKAGYEAVLKLDPENANARLLLAFLELESGQLDSARRELEALLQKHPNSQEGLTLKAQMKLIDFEPEAALGFIGKAESVASENGETALVKGQALLMLQRSRQARQVLRHARELAPESMTVLTTGAWAALLDGDLLEARTWFEESVAKDAELADGHAGLATIAMLEQDDEAATARMERALEIDPQNIPALMVKNSLTEKRGDPQAAAEGTKALFETYAIGPFGWTPKSLVEQFARSEAGGHAFKKASRLRHRRTGLH